MPPSNHCLNARKWYAHNNYICALNNHVHAPKYYTLQHHSPWSPFVPLIPGSPIGPRDPISPLCIRILSTAILILISVVNDHKFLLSYMAISCYNYLYSYKTNVSGISIVASYYNKHDIRHKQAYVIYR